MRISKVGRLRRSQLDRHKDMQENTIIIKILRAPLENRLTHLVISHKEFKEVLKEDLEEIIQIKEIFNLEEDSEAKPKIEVDSKAKEIEIKEHQKEVDSEVVTQEYVEVLAEEEETEVERDLRKIEITTSN
jgi:hypothetical protein